MKPSWRLSMALMACLAWTQGVWAQGAAASAGPDPLHPPKLTVDVKDAPLAEFATALNKQMGGEYVQVDTSVGGVPPKVTLKAQEQPLWVILKQLADNVPVTFMPVCTREKTGTINTFNLAPDRRPGRFFVEDGVCVAAQITGNPATDEWALSCMIWTDPRVRLTTYQSDIQVDQAFDQDGRELKAIMPKALPPAPRDARAPGKKYATGLPDCVARCKATFARDAGMKLIKELRGSVAVEVAESQEIVNVDLTKELKPLATTMGTITVEKTGGGLMIQVAPSDPKAGAALGSRLAVRVFDDQGTPMVAPSSALSTPMRLTFAPSFGAARPAATLELAIPGKTREVKLPIVVKNLEIPVPEPPGPDGINRPGWDSVPRRP